MNFKKSLVVFFLKIVIRFPNLLRFRILLQYLLFSFIRILLFRILAIFEITPSVTSPSQAIWLLSVLVIAHFVDFEY